MSKMGLLGAIGFSLALVSLIQIPYTSAEDCDILSITPAGPSSMLVKWKRYSAATSYFLDFRVRNTTHIAPVVVSIRWDHTEKLVRGLKPGTLYSVTLKVFEYYYVVCTDTDVALTVPDTSHIIFSRPISSTSFAVNWTEVASAQYYYLVVKNRLSGEALNLTYTNQSAVVWNVEPRSSYDCHIYSANEAGIGISSKARTVTTLIPPPLQIMAEQTSPTTAIVRWLPVKDVLMYRVTITNEDQPDSMPSVFNVRNTQWQITDILPCTTYLVSVSSLNDFLVPGESTDYSYTTNKLKPVESVSISYSCTDNAVEVSWSAMLGADSYDATAIDMDGRNMSCITEKTTCSITGLNCGQSYTVHVVPISESCRSRASSSSATFDTGPCPPKNLTLVRECSSNNISFSWEPTDGINYYMAKAVDSQGGIKECLTADHSCDFLHSVCGRLYSFTVLSIRGMCQSQISETIQILTAPCIPRNVQVQSPSECDTNVLLKWDVAEGAVNYTVMAKGNRNINSTYTCSSFSTSCSIRDISCGEHLTIYITASDGQCTSPKSLVAVAETVPCIVQNVNASRDCGADSITVTWGIAGGAIFYISKAVDSNGVSHICNSANLSCNIAGLKCSTNYTVFAIASNIRCESAQSKTVTLETAACPPDNLQAQLDCAANEALLSWRGQPHMISYTAMMVDEEDRLFHCNTVDTSCRIGSMPCGQVYSVTVAHHDGICPSMPSRPIYMESVPCGPANVQTNVDCASGELTVDWNPSTNAEFYMTVISDNNGKMSYNTSEPPLSVRTLECGLEYTVLVMSINSTCLSLPSETKTVHEVPCVPTNVTVERNCGQSSVKVRWDASRGAKNYTAVAVGTERRRIECSSTETTCMLDNLLCSHVYNISVFAVHDHCSSMKSDEFTLRTAPCPPSQLDVSVDCASNSVTLNWSTSPNAVSYTGKAVAGDGHSVTCDVGVEMGCQLNGLNCDQQYIFTVSASDGECRTPDSKPVSRTTAPCGVQNVLDTLDCSTNALTISWLPGSLPINYSVIADSGDGPALSCITEGSTCEMTNLKCGQLYTVMVKGVSSTCEGPTTTLPIIPSVPCVPANVHGAVECSSNALQMSWDATAGALSYISTVNGAGSFSDFCNTTAPSCQLPGLQCAQTYTFSVVAVNQRCKSPMSTEASVITAPCDPANVAAELDCSSDAVTVGWEASAGAQHYTVVAQANESDHTSSCKSTGSSCQLNQLQCGEEYTVIVMAGDGSCNSTMLAKTTIKTAPCPPVIQDHLLDCSSNHVSVSWAKDEDALDVKVSVVSTMGHATSCSSTTNTSCVLEDLQCGHTYTAQAVAKGEMCFSKPSSTFEIVAAPCTPQNVAYTYSCDTGITMLSWDQTLGKESFYARIQSGDHMESCSVTDTHCSLASLRCGRLYTVMVLAVASHCNSSQPGTAEIQTAPCAPESVNASLVCENNTAAVSWLPSFGAVLYNVTAIGRDGDIKRCSTTTTSCLLPNMHCAQIYGITVTPFSSTCMGISTAPFQYIAGSCPPKQVQSSLQCNGNMGHLTWQPDLYATSYIATLRDNNKHEHICRTSPNEASCSLTDLHCGETGFITVVSVERGCKSEPSEPAPFTTAICPPTGVTGATACATNDVTVNWDPSPRSGVSYILHSQVEDEASVTYATDQTSYEISGLPCGKMYTVSVAAKDSACTSILSQSAQNETVPCPPTSLTAEPECGTNSAMLTWEASAGAISYTATAIGEHGHESSCHSNTTSCSVKLDCGRQYIAIVVASSENCNSITGATLTQLTFNSAPCLPDNVVANLDCASNSFAVQWNARSQDGSFYTAIAIGSDNTRETCDTTATSCTIQNLKCGLTYSIVVTTASVNCGLIKDSDYKMQSAPCKPGNPVASLDCRSSVAVVKWENTGPDQENVVTAEDIRGTTTTCNSTGSNCTLNQLSCGETYVISVVGKADKCSSEPSFTQRLLTAPCVPTHLTASMDCNTGITGVSWDSARGAERYTVFAQGSLDHNATCTSTDSNCYFSNLACGQNYDITVMSHNLPCDSLASDHTHVTTVPCPHSNLMASLDCKTNTALVSWTPGRGIVSYNATANSLQNTHQLHCSTNDSACNISSLPCGENFKVIVTGQGEKCQSPPRDMRRFNSVPCPPTELMVVTSCKSNNISVSWITSKGSISYMAVAENAQGHQLSCNTSTTTCQIQNLMCGEQYQVHVVGRDADCFGDASDIKVIHTAPCVPHVIQHHLDCPSGDLNVTWQQTGHASHFHVFVESSNGEVSTCNTVEHHCVISSLQCGLTYTYEVVAQGNGCNDSRSPKQELTTAPCPPMTFLAPVNCDTGVVSVSWHQSVPGVLYMVSAVDATGHQHNCSTTDTVSCDLTTLECGTEYSITITPSRNGCVGTESPPKTTQTVPCVPHLAEVEMDCLSNTPFVIFNASAGAEGYVVTATNSTGAELIFECTSTDACALLRMPCSQNLTFTIKARDSQCSSAPSNAYIAETPPCTPQDIYPVPSCKNNTISVFWSPTPGAVMYTATLEQTDGKTTCCSSSGTSCNITGLPCGQMYLVLVVAEGRTCNSSQSTGDLVRTEPCVPENLQASLSCSNNVASMTWNYSLGGQLYRVRAEAPDGHMHECSSSQNQCDLVDLHCGEYYTATVVAEVSDCVSDPSDSVQIKTVPCTPQNVSSEINCEENCLTVSWSESAGADAYLATVQGSNGLSTTCQAMNEAFCNVTGLSCGQIYHTSVISSNGYCDSPPSSVVDAPSAPCKPNRIKAIMDCPLQKITVSWYPSDGASLYKAMAVTASGHAIMCETTDTNCELGGLLCGQSYSISVRAMGQTCNSIAHMTGQVATEPCIPEHISTHYSLAIGQVLWDVSLGAEYYTVEAITDQGLRESCRTTDTYCPISNMVCSQTYNISVTAHNDACDTAKSTQEAIIKTEPCPPTNVQASVKRDGKRGTVTWEPSVGAVGYVAHVVGRDGHSLSCYSTTTFCDVDDLHCGITYHVRAVSIGEELNSTESITFLLVSAPCAAENVVADFDCDTARISWSPADGAMSYLVKATGSDSHQAFCKSVATNCDLNELKCGQIYNISLTVYNNDSQTEDSTNASFCARPCKPLYVGVDLECGTSTANLYWQEQEGVELYVATATYSMGTTQCNSTNSTCKFHNLKCGETYQFSVTAHSHGCHSDVSSTVDIQTEPCQPANLTVIGSCDSTVVTLDWSEAKGASAYIVRVMGDLGYVMAFQINETLLEIPLLCGQTFSFTVKAKDSRCGSPVSQPAEFRTGPCVPQHVESYTHCEDSLGAVSWAPADGAESYIAIAVGLDGHTHECVSENNTCTWDDLHCGEHYTVEVVANYYLCSSMPSNSTRIRMAPCVPQNLKASMNCSLKAGYLTWNASETAEAYIVTAQTNSGHKVQLSTNETSTFIAELMCGQEYYLSVQAVDSVCRSVPSVPEVLKSAPCPPTDVSSTLDCLSNIAVISWTASAGAEFYTAQVTGEGGDEYTCMSEGTACGLSNLACGQNYTIVVIASSLLGGSECDSYPSEPDSLQAAPCVPNNVALKLDCPTNIALVSWSPSQGALDYSVTAKSNLGAVSSCESTDPRCTLTNLMCGHIYSIQVVARDNICSSLPSPAETLNSVPCTPNAGSVVLDCFAKTFLSEWSYAEGAVKYTTTAQSASGSVSTCTTNSTNCRLKQLQCGQIYSVTTVASNDLCDSLPSVSLPVRSIPCPPQAVSTSLDCSSNTARVEWQRGTGADSYIVQAIGVEEHMTGCETDSQACVIPDLMCGFTYRVSVISINSVCNVSESDVTQLETVPCVPKLIETNVQCESGAVAMSWEQSKGAHYYTVLAQGSGGYESTHNSSESSFLFDHLLCGLSYTITVSASDDSCTSAESNSEQINTVPCIPQRTAAEMVCSTNTGLVSWEEEDAVSAYLVKAAGPDGHRIQCRSTQSSCQLPNMHCGQLYNLTVIAEDDRCDISKAALNLQSVPCSPTYVKASLQCHTSTIAVTWERSSGAAFYQAQGFTSGGHQIQCNNTATFCDLSDPLCGQAYSIRVVAKDDTCQSVEGNIVVVQTAPCTPQDVHVEVQCDTHSIDVSWSPNPDAEHFHVEAVSSTGALLHCHSDGTRCTLNSLPCGQSYNITVVSERNGCESKPSPVKEACSAPCVPENAKGSLDCVTNSAWVTWDGIEGALSYYVLAEEAGGHNDSCSSSSSSCNVPDLKCGTLYTFHVTAINEYCISANSTPFDLETGPCALSSIIAVSECHSNTIQVEWEMTSNMPIYVVTAEGDDQSLISCNSSTNSCLLKDVSCGMHYSIIVSASSDKCSSLRSPPKKISTAPCVPMDVTAIPLCEEKGAVVHWARSMVATSYHLTATAANGHVKTFNTTLNNINLADLHCSQLYRISITATSGNCTSHPSIVPFRTVPCEPTGLKVDMQCETNSAVVSWDVRAGSVVFIASAESQDGDKLYCQSFGTSCTIQGLECGSMYNFTVEGSNGICNTSLSAPLLEGAAPCAPTTVNVRMQRIDNAHWVMISWNTISCPDVTYLAEITGRIQDSPLALMDISSYWLPRPYFEFPMPCSTTYNLTVRSRNAAGASDPSSVFVGITVPCPPQNVKYSGSHSSMLSWDASLFATKYSVYSVASERVELCSTTELSCQLTNLDLATTEVTASNDVGESIPTSTITASNRRRRDLRATQILGTLQPELGCPEIQNVTVNGVSLYVKWTQVDDATEYIVLIEEEQAKQERIVINVENDLSYIESYLKPWTTYCVRLAAKNTTYQSKYSNPKCTKTGAR